MIEENTECPRCEAKTDLYKGTDGRYLCLHCWVEKRGVTVSGRGNGKSQKAFSDFKRRVRA